MLINGIKAELDEIATSKADEATLQAKLAELSTSLGDKAKALAAAVAAVPAPAEPPAA